MPRVNLPALGRSLARLRVREARQGVRVRQVAVEADKCRQSSRHGPPAAQAASGALDPLDRSRSASSCHQRQILNAAFS